LSDEVDENTKSFRGVVSPNETPSPEDNAPKICVDAMVEIDVATLII